jgi:hypothetical protein
MAAMIAVTGSWLCLRPRSLGVDGSEASVTPTGDFLLTVDLGVLPMGQSARHCCWLQNRSRTAMQIARFKSSCECVQVTAHQLVIAPGAKTLLTVSYDGQKDREFSGSLAVTVVAEGTGAIDLGRISVCIDVVRELN